MKYIIAIVQPSRLEAVKESLSRVEVFRLTVGDVQGLGRQKGHTELYRGAEYVIDFLPKAKLEVAVDSSMADQVVEAIIKTANTGHIGDGNLHVSLTIGDDSMERHDEVDEVIYSMTAEYNGSISAEHGIGRLKRGHLSKSRTEAELALMHTLKAALDPNNILGQGRVLG